MTPLSPEERTRWNSYLSDEDQRVLSNIPGIVNFDEWKRAEHSHVEGQLLEIRLGEISIDPTFDLIHAQAIHGALFGGFYAWAGRCRQVPLSDGRLEFAPHQDIETTLDGAGRYFTSFIATGGGRDAFIVAACQAVSRWNYAHPFREGNGRTMKVALDQFAEPTPWQFDFAKVTPDQWNTASMLSMPAPDTNWQPQPQNLHAVFDRITDDRATRESADNQESRE